MTIHYEASHIDNKTPIYRMEDFTTNRDYYTKLFHHFTGGKLKCDQEYLDRVFSIGKVNPHRRASNQSLHVFGKWNNHFKIMLYALTADGSNSNIAKYYHSIGYPTILSLVEEPD